MIHRILSLFLAALIGASSLWAEIPFNNRHNIAVRYDDKWAFRYKGRLQTPAAYDMIVTLGDNRACFLAMVNDKWGLVSATNRVVVPFEYDQISNALHLRGFQSTEQVIYEVYSPLTGDFMPFQHIQLPLPMNKEGYRDNPAIIPVAKKISKRGQPLDIYRLSRQPHHRYGI